MGRPRALRLLMDPVFGSYTLAGSISMVGTWAQRMACMYLVWQMTGSAFWVGVLSMTDMLPVVVVGLFAGAAADRWNPFALTRLCQAVLTVLAFGFGLCASMGWLGLGTLIWLSLAQGIVVAFAQPARMTLVQSLVVRDDLAAAVALSSVSLNITRLAGPALGGLLLVLVPVEWIFYLNAVLTFGFVLVLFAIPSPPRIAPRAEGTMLALVFGGLRYTATHAPIRKLMISLFVGGLTVRSMPELYPAFSARNFATVAQGLAVLSSSTAVGAILAGVWLGSGQVSARLERQTALSWLAGGMSVGLFAISPWAASDVLLVALIGFFLTGGVISTQTYAQIHAPEDLRGRVLGVHGLVSRGSPPIGALLGGLAIDRIGTAASALILAAISVAVAGATLVRGR